MGRKSRVYVAKSSLPDAGRGVFAGQDFTVDDYLMYYDGYIKENDNFMTSKEEVYAICVENNKTLIGYSKPRHKFGIAQLCNDYCCPKVSEELSFVSLEHRVKLLAVSFLEYLSESLKHENIVSDDNISFCTKYNIKKGDEFFFHYGICYWMNALIKKRYETPIHTALLVLEYISDTLYKKLRSMRKALEKIISTPFSEFYPYGVKDNFEKFIHERMMFYKEANKKNPMGLKWMYKEIRV